MLPVWDFSCWARASLNGETQHGVFNTIDTDAVVVPPRWIPALRAAIFEAQKDDIATVTSRMSLQSGSFEASVALRKRHNMLSWHTKVKVPTSLVVDWADLVIKRIVTECREKYTCVVDWEGLVSLVQCGGRSVGTLAAGYPAKDASMIAFGDALRSIKGFAPPMYVSYEYAKSWSFALHF